jgi:hypothetical protein
MLRPHWKARERNQADIEHPLAPAMFERCRIVRTLFKVIPNVQNRNSAFAARIISFEIGPRQRPFRIVVNPFSHRVVSQDVRLTTNFLSSPLA